LEPTAVARGAALGVPFAFALVALLGGAALSALR